MNEAPVLIDITLITGNPYQMRHMLDGAAVQELAENILRNGLLQPPTVRLMPGMQALSAPERIERGKEAYELAFGHTRLAAFKLLANSDDSEKRMFYRQIPCFIKDLDDLQMFELAVSENIKRRNLNPVETATAMQTYQEKFQKTSAETGEFFNVDEATVRGTVRLLKLPETARAKLAAGEITMGAARQLLVLVRVAPESIENAVKRIINGDQPDRVVSDALDGLVYHNKAIKMWAGWRSGKPSGGSGLWELDAPVGKSAKYMPPVAGLEGLNKHLVRKLAESDGVVSNGGELEDWACKLQGGLVAPEALIAQGAPADTIERLNQLVNPPACTACPFYVREQNNHYCTWKVCHTRKKEAWAWLEMEKHEKKLEIRQLSADEARAGFVVLGNSYNSETRRQEEAAIAAKDHNLRLHIKPGQYEHPFTKSEIVEVVSIAPAAVEKQKKTEESPSDRRG
jgi:ParB family chromosome partitioning protein